MPTLFPRAFRRKATAAVVTVLLTACTAGVTPSIEPTAGPSTAPATEASVDSMPTTAASDEPTPLAAWQLDTNGAGSPGETLKFAGAHKFDRGAVALDGVTGYGATTGAGPLDTTRSFTVAAWVTVSEKTPFAAVLSQVGDTAAAFYLGVAEGAWAFSMKDEDTNEGTHTIRAMATRPLIDPAAWVHLAGVFDRTAGKIVLYIDGQRVAETPFKAPWLARGPMMLGGARTRGQLSDFWPGAIAGATVYQEALAGDEIVRLRDASRPTKIAPVLPAPSADPVLEALRGTWDYASTSTDPKAFRQLLTDAAAEAGKPGAEVALRLGLNGQRWWLGFVLDGELWLLNGVPEGDLGTMTVEGDKLTMTNGKGGWITYRWRVKEDRLTLALLECVNQTRSGECPDKEVVDMVTSHTYTRSGTDPNY